jgi:uncharacterized membrane protein (UPF0127 family)
MSRRGRAQLQDQDGKVVIPDLLMAESFLGRLRGLIGRAPLQSHEALLITPWNAVHTFWMRYPLRVTFLDRDGVVLHCVETLAPRRMARCPEAAFVIEQSAESSCVHLEVGKHYHVASASPSPSLRTSSIRSTRWSPRGKRRPRRPRSPS